MYLGNTQTDDAIFIIVFRMFLLKKIMNPMKCGEKTFYEAEQFQGRVSSRGRPINRNWDKKSGFKW